MGGYVVLDTNVRDTLKGLNETKFPIVMGTPMESHAIYYTQCNRSNSTRHFEGIKMKHSFLLQQPH